MATRKKITCESFEIYSFESKIELDNMSDLLEHFSKLNDQFNMACLSMNSIEIFEGGLNN